MNLMFIIPSLGCGGAERVTSIVASQLAQRYRVTIVTYFEADQPYAVSDKAEVVCLNVSDGKGSLEKLKNSLARVRKLRRLKRKLKTDVAVSMLSSPNFENVMSRRGERVIVSLRNKMSEQCKGYNRLLNKIACQRADRVVAVCENVRQDQHRHFGTPLESMQTIYNPCDPAKIREMAGQRVEDAAFERILESASHVVITAGRLTRQKGQWHLIRAFSQVVERDPRAALVILGEGKLREELDALIRALGLENNVFILGFKDNPYYYMSRADVFALSSLFEGFANVLIEAMACGLPIVACDCNPGPRELLAPNTDFSASATQISREAYGVLTPVCSGSRLGGDAPLEAEERLLGQAIAELLADEALRARYAGQSQVRVADFSVEEIVSQWNRIIEEVR